MMKKLGNILMEMYPDKIPVMIHYIDNINKKKFIYKYLIDQNEKISKIRQIIIKDLKFKDPFMIGSSSPKIIFIAETFIKDIYQKYHNPEDECLHIEIFKI